MMGKKQKLKILIIEDDQYFRRNIASQLNEYGEVFEASSLSSGIQKLEGQNFDVAFIDLNLGAGGHAGGLELIRLATAKNIYPIVLTNYDDDQTIQAVYSLGCRHFFHKLEFQSNVKGYVGPYLKALQSDKIEEFFKTKFITQDEQLINSILLLRYQNITMGQKIFITGPTGVGKSLVARLIHQISSKKEDPFIHTNLTELPENLVESHLFGHAKGSFTGAVRDHSGLFEQANGGTLFLDEIGTLPLFLQKKLLRVLEKGEFSPVGSNQRLQSKHRLITATCDDVGKLIQEEKFRPDLYFRIKGIEINIPPLKHRRSDIPLLINHFLSKSARKIILSEPVQKILQEYDWYGNVRELENLLASFINSDLGLIQPGHLPEYILTNRNPFKAGQDNKLFTRAVANFIAKNGLPEYVKIIEKEALRSSLQKTGGKITKAQSYLKVPSRNTIYRIKKMLEEEGNHGIEPEYN